MKSDKKIVTIAGLRDFEDVYRGLVDTWVLYDNSGTTHTLVALGDNT
jgi:hypothetical protein